MSQANSAERDTEVRCPKCKGRDFVVTVIEACEAQNRVRAGKWVSTFGESAMPTRTASYCRCDKCGHDWRLRNVYAV